MKTLLIVLTLLPLILFAEPKINQPVNACHFLMHPTEHAIEFQQSQCPATVFYTGDGLLHAFVSMTVHKPTSLHGNTSYIKLTEQDIDSNCVIINDGGLHFIAPEFESVVMETSTEWIMELTCLNGVLQL